MSSKGFGVLSSGLGASRDLIQNEIWAVSLLLRNSTSLIGDDFKGAFRKASDQIKRFARISPISSVRGLEEAKS